MDFLIGVGLLAVWFWSARVIVAATPRYNRPMILRNEHAFGLLKVASALALLGGIGMFILGIFRAIF